MAASSFLSSLPSSSQRRGMPYRSGGHTNAAAIAEFGGESNYVDGPRRRRSPPVSLSAPFSSSQPSQHLLIFVGARAAPTRHPHPHV